MTDAVVRMARGLFDRFAALWLRPQRQRGARDQVTSRYQRACALLAFAVTAAAVQACGGETTPVGRDAASSAAGSDAPAVVPVALPDPAAMEAVNSAPRARTVSLNELGQAALLRPYRGDVMREPMPDGTTGEEAARLHLRRYREQLGLSEEAVDALVMQGEHRLPAGAAIYHFGQRVHDLPVFQARAKLVLDGSKNLLSLANGLAPSWLQTPTTADFAISRKRAIASAYIASGGRDLLLDAVREHLRRDHDWRDYAVQIPPGRLGVLDATVRPVMYAEDDRFVTAYHVEITTRSASTGENQGYRYAIAAADGRVLYRASLTANEAFKYRVFAHPDGVPMDGPIVDITPHPTGVPDVFLPEFVEPTLVEMDGFNMHGDPWLTASATYSFGNNVQAYSDRNQGNGIFSTGGGFQEGADYRAETTSTRTFDRIYDLAGPPNASPDQIKASVTQVFYVTNWLHDYYYDSGFDEASGNAQVDNYGRGGAGGDPLLTEAQDGADSGRANNANMSTPGDGRSPRMQMYLWAGAPNRKLVTVPPIELDDWIGAATFGPSTFDLPPAELVIVDDGSTARPFGVWTGTGSVTDACQPPSNVSGKIAVIDRGLCNFSTKVQNAEAAGAVAAIIINNTQGHVAPSPAANASTVGIPTLALSYEDGEKVKARLREGPLMSMTFSRGSEVGRDGAIDNTVVAHEWGHYLHMRLQNGSNSQYYGMSEGWGDFNSLFMTIREGDKFSGRSYALAQYAGGGTSARASYYGIRRAPYSVEYTMNPFTFGHIRASAELPDYAPLAVSGDAPMNEAHMVGEIWAQMLFEVYVNILEVGEAAGRPFEDNKRRMADYVVAALKAAPDDPSFVEQRDAFLSVARAMAAQDPSREADVDAMARAFAKRGLGAGAVAPPKRSSSLDEAVESFLIPDD